MGLNDFEAGNIHYLAHLKGWALVMDIARFKIMKSKGHIKKQVLWGFYVHEFLVYWLWSLQATQAARVRFLARDNCLFLQSYN